MSGPDKRIFTHFIAQAGVRTMPGHYRRVFVEGVQTLLDRTHDGGLVATPQIRAPYPALEQRVAGNQQLSLGR